MTSFNKQNVSTEVFKPGEILTYTVGATAVANTPVNGVIPITLVEASADRTVIPAAAGSLICVGGALHDGAIGDTDLAVVSCGVWWVKASGVITAGARLKCGAVGTVVVAGATPDASAVIGIALEAIASGSVGRVKLINLG